MTTQDETHSQHFSKGLVFGLDDYQFCECSFTKICCAKC